MGKENIKTMNAWNSCTLLLNGKFISPGTLDEQLIIETDVLAVKVLEFYREWIGEGEEILLQTSGSTGKPKKLLVLKQSLIESAFATVHFFGLAKAMKALLCLSPDFIAGKMMIVRAMVSEMNLITTDVSANPVENLETVIDFTAMVPLQVNQILKQSPEKFHFLKTVIIGGSAMDVKLENDLQNIESQCFHTYGMTETLSHIALRPINGITKSDWFTPFDNIGISNDKRGCLIIAAPFIQKEPIVTNDMAEIDENGNFKIQGRIDNVIVSAGRKIHPEEVEQKIRHLFNKPFIISALKDERAGETVVLFCEENPGIKALYQLWRELSETMETYEIPRQIIHIERIHFLESGKVDRKRVFN
jgi:O-succinylbenzoic acid--CoA ligase